MKKKQQRDRTSVIQTHITSHSASYLFILAWILNILIKCVKFPSLTIRPEVFAESGTNFFVNAYYHDLWTNFTAVDAGYLPWVQRVIAVITVKVFHAISLYPYITQWVAIMFLTLFCSIIILPVFRKLISSDLNRFLIAIAIGMISDYELNAFINFIYFGSIITFLMIFINKEKMKRVYVVLLGLLAGFIFCSKGAFIIFLPVYIGASIIHYFRKQSNSTLYYGIASCFGVLQAVVLFSHASGVRGGEKGILALAFYLFKTFYYLLLTYRHVLFGSFLTDKGVFLSFIFTIVIITLGIWKIMQQRNTYLLLFILLGNILAFTSLFLTVYLAHNTIDFQVLHNKSTQSILKSEEQPVVPVTIQIDKSLFFVKHFVNLRSMFFSNLIIFLVAIVIILPLFENKRYQILVLGCIIYASGAFGQLSVEEPYPQQSKSVSQWQIYSSLIRKPEYCLPINPYPFVIAKDCEYLTTQGLGEKNPSLAKRRVISMMLLNYSKYERKDVRLYAYDAEGKLLAKAERLTPFSFDYVYFMFEKPIQGVTSISLNDTKKQTVPDRSEVLVYGR